MKVPRFCAARYDLKGNGKGRSTRPPTLWEDKSRNGKLKGKGCKTCVSIKGDPKFAKQRAKRRRVVKPKNALAR